MSIYKVRKRENPFVQIDKTMIQDNRLSFKAKGILTYLLSRPDNWQVYEVEIIKHAKDGRESVRSGIKELIDNGYIEREERRNERGHFKGYEYSVYEIPNRVVKPDFGKSDIGKSNTTNNDLSNKDLNKNYKRYTITGNGDDVLDLYGDKFKERYGREHPTVTEEQLQDIRYKLMDFDCSLSDYDEIMDDYFDNLPASNDGKIFAFVRDGLLNSPLRRYM